MAPQAWAEPLVSPPCGGGTRRPWVAAGPGLTGPHTGVSRVSPGPHTDSQERGRSFLLKGRPPAGLEERWGSGQGRASLWAEEVPSATRACPCAGQRLAGPRPRRRLSCDQAVRTSPDPAMTLAGD